MSDIKLNEWCEDCKEYDNNRHCCPRWNRVIRNTVEELKAEHRWIPVTERQPEESGWYIVTCISTENGVDRRVCIRWYSTFHGFEWDERPIAWMPLPEPYKEGKNV